MAEEKLSMEVSVEENGTCSEPVNGNGNNEEEASSEPSSTLEKDEDETKGDAFFLRITVFGFFFSDIAHWHQFITMVQSLGSCLNGV